MIRVEVIRNTGQPEQCNHCLERPATIVVYVEGRIMTDVRRHCGVCALDLSNKLEKAVYQSQDAALAHNVAEGRKGWIDTSDIPQSER